MYNDLNDKKKNLLCKMTSADFIMIMFNLNRNFNYCDIVKEYMFQCHGLIVPVFNANLIKVNI